MKKTAAAILAAMVLFATASSCDDKKGGDTGGSTSKVTLSFGKYYTPAGTVKTPTWTAGELAGAVNCKTGVSGTAKALGSGETSAIFLFPLGTVNAKDMLACYHPSDAFTFDKGSLVTVIPTKQEGKEIRSAQLGIGLASGSSYTGTNINLKTVPCELRATVAKGNYSIVKAEIKALGGEKLAGKTTIDPNTLTASASEAGVVVELATALDCRSASQVVPVFVAPVTLKNGFEVTYTTSEGDSFKASFEGPVNFEMGGKLDTDPVASDKRKLIAAGSTKVYLFYADEAAASGNYASGLLWSWSSTDFSFGKSTDHIDDCKVVNDGKQFLVTCSNNNSWCALINYPKGDVAFSVTDATNAHSSELLPNDRIVVASSDGGDKLLLYNMDGKLLSSNNLTSAHGVVWMSSVQRLYAIGGTSLQVYSLKDWNTSTPSLYLEKTISTTGYVAGLHDASKVNDNYIAVAGSASSGHSCSVFNVNTETFTVLTHFNNIVGMKSINYNPESGEAYYTYAAAGTSEGGYDWSSKKVRYSDDLTKQATGDGTGTSNWSYITVGDINLYKVRVYNW